jgi:hypothetical protein
MKTLGVVGSLFLVLLGDVVMASGNLYENQCESRMRAQLEAVDDPHYTSQEVLSKLLTLRGLAKGKASFVNYSECGPSNYLTLRLEIATCRIEVTTGDSDGDCND